MCLFPPLIWALVAGGAFILVAVTFFSSLTFQSLQITKSHTSTAILRRSKHIMHCSAFRSVTSFLIFDVVFTTVFQKLNSNSPIESSANKKKRPQRRIRCSDDENVFFVNSNLFPALIGNLTTQVRVINMTIQLERWVSVLPTADRTLQLLCESWSRKWIVIFILWPRKTAVEIQSWSIIETPGYILFLDRL